MPQKFNSKSKSSKSKAAPVVKRSPTVAGITPALPAPGKGALISTDTVGKKKPSETLQKNKKK